jgi:hypothetical protein
MERPIGEINHGQGSKGLEKRYTLSHMTFRAFSFTLTDFESGQLLGLALVCPEARYASVLATGGTRFDRRHALPSQWKELEADLARLPASPLDRSSTIVRLLLDVDRQSNVTVQPLTGLPADVEPERSAQLLDALLTGMAARPDRRLQEQS